MIPPWADIPSYTVENVGGQTLESRGLSDAPSLHSGAVQQMIDWWAGREAT